ncbi:MAG: methyltransferase [Candidatus Margulisiibacteriota bacterium]
MKIQLFFVILFALNQGFLWLTLTNKSLRSFKTLGAILFVLIPFLPVFFGQPRFELDYFWWRVSGPIAILMGSVFIYLGYMEFKKNSASILDIPKKLVDSKVYAHIRHPQYLGLIFIFVGWWWIWAAVYSFYFGMFILALIWIQGYLEETIILSKAFGKKFIDYKNRTGMYWIK